MQRCLCIQKEVIVLALKNKAYYQTPEWKDFVTGLGQKLWNPIIDEKYGSCCQNF